VISTHVLDTSNGVPAAGVPVKLQKKTGAAWQDFDSGVTNADGRASFESETATGVYQIVFEVEEYLKKLNRPSFYVSIPVIFKVEDSKRKYHVPLLLNPFGYSTYRGS
jgi:5-hydroxyisourate hydrolase